MILHSNPLFSIYFGGSADAMYPDQCLTWQQEVSIIHKPQLQPIVYSLSLQHIFFLHQVHGTEGTLVTRDRIATFRSFLHEGDFLITDIPAVGIGVISADCLPVVCVDRKNRVVAIAHAGWRGALSGVVSSMIKAMRSFCTSSLLNDYIFFLGPSARGCCYQVGSEFEYYLAPYSWKNEVLFKKDSHYFFDVSVFVQRQLYDIGISGDAISNVYNQCTICNVCFHSFRRYGRKKNSGRQMSIVALR